VHENTWNLRVFGDFPSISPQHRPQMQRDRDKINCIQICFYAESAFEGLELWGEVKMIIIYAGYQIFPQRVCQQAGVCHLFQWKQSALLRSRAALVGSLIGRQYVNVSTPSHIYPNLPIPSRPICPARFSFGFRCGRWWWWRAWSSAINLNPFSICHFTVAYDRLQCKLS